MVVGHSGGLVVGKAVGMVGVFKVASMEKSAID